MGKDVLRKFWEGKREFQIETTYYFGYRGYDKGFNIELDGNSVSIDYYTQYIRLGNYYNVIDKTGIAYKENTRTNKYLENFVNIVSKICDEIELYFFNKKIRIKIIWKEEILEKTVYIITEIKDEVMKVFYAHEEFFYYLLIYYLENIENFETEREVIEKGLEDYYNKIDKERRESPVIDLKNLFDRFH